MGVAREVPMRKDRLAYFKKRLIEKQRQLADEVGRTALYGKDQDDDSIKDLGDQANTAYNREFFFELGNGDRRLLRDVVSALQKLDGGAARPRRRRPPGGTVPRSGDALPADPPGSAEPPRRVTWPARPRRRGRAVGGGARAPAAHPRRRGAHATGGRDRVVGHYLLRARAGGARPVEHGRGARAPEERGPHGPHVPSRSARPRRRLRGDRRSPRGGASLGARRGGAAGASALGTARAWLSRGGAAQADDRALPAGPGACARRARARPGARPRLLRARDAGRGGRPVREGRGAGAGPPGRARVSRRRVRAARRDARGLRRVPARAPARSRVRVAAPVRRVRGCQCLVAGPVSRLPPLEHPPSRPRLTPLSLAVFPRLAIAALDPVFPAP